MFVITAAVWRRVARMVIRCSKNTDADHLVGERGAEVKDEGRRSGTSEGSLCNQVSDVQGVAHSWDIVAQEH